jgi:hypothetical protein
VSDEFQPDEAERLVGRAFGAESRRRMLDEYFARAPVVTASNAWQHIYRLLLWIDSTTGLAHCYESDKAQPGRPWYSRSLAFHAWLAAALQTTPAGLGDDIDWLFRRGTEVLARAMAASAERRADRARVQREPYSGQGMPEPGQNLELEVLIREELAPWLRTEVPPEVLHKLIQRIRAYLGQENKRKNLVGEGFEDVLAALIRRLPGGEIFDTRPRVLLSAVPGFREPPPREKERKVDLAIVGRAGRRVLVSAKWSVRADREEQFGIDFEAYARLDTLGQDFAFVLITNEFDAARLAIACERRGQNALLFSDVVHVNPEGVQAAYGRERRGAAARIVEHMQSGRLLSLERWLGRLLQF